MYICIIMAVAIILFGVFMITKNKITCLNRLKVLDAINRYNMYVIDNVKSIEEINALIPLLSCSDLAKVKQEIKPLVH